jgi:signal transduction histidine kinase/tetratricopeptide (TPR) repeat protein
MIGSSRQAKTPLPRAKVDSRYSRVYPSYLPEGTGVMRLNWQRRAVILFAVSLLVLSIFLVGFMLREAEREKLLNERELEAAGQRLVEAIDARAQSLIGDAENRIGEAVRRLPPDSGPTRAPALRAFATDVPLVHDVFLVDDRDRILSLGAGPLYLLPGQDPPDSAGTGDIVEGGERWKQAEAAEFRQNDPAGAASLYKTLADTSSKPAEKALALNRLARCYAKSGQNEKALAAYAKQLRAGLPGLASEGIPLDIAALSQVGRIQLGLERKAEAAGAFLELYRGLVEARWVLTRDQFDFFRKWAEERVGRATEDMDPAGREDWAGRLRGLKEEEGERLARTKALEKVRERLIPRMRLESGRLRADPGRPVRLAEPTDDGLLLASFRPLDEGVTIGLLFDPEGLAKALAAGPESSGETGPRFGLSAAIVDGSGEAEANQVLRRPEGPGESGDVQPIYAAAFSGGFPPWSIEALRTGAGATERQFRLRRGLYLLTLAAVIAALVFGGFLAIRSTAKELRLAKLKSDFAATVSHEFRTPLTSIRYMAELLQRGRVPDEARKQQYYETISGESERLSRLVENMLDFSKIEAGAKEYRMEEADIAVLAAEVADRFRQQAGSKDFILKTEIADDLPRVRVDRDALGRAVLNLLDNAVKYSGKEPRLTLRVRSAGNAIHLQVEDNGIGIPMSEQKKIFDKFYRSESAVESAVKGSGIGLPLVEHVARAHGGDVALESEIGRGTRVTIRIPAGSPEEK